MPASPRPDQTNVLAGCDEDAAIGQERTGRQEMVVESIAAMKDLEAAVHSRRSAYSTW